MILRGEVVLEKSFVLRRILCLLILEFLVQSADEIMPERCLEQTKARKAETLKQSD